jgi:hypothetical protein
LVVVMVVMAVQLLVQTPAVAAVLVVIQAMAA